MCLNIHVVCPGCGLLVEQIYQECFYQGVLRGHMVYPQIKTLQYPELLWWSCSTVDCELNQSLQWSLASLHDTAMRKGQAYSQKHSYATLEVDDEGDEACELALAPDEVGVPGAPFPNYLSAEGRLTARKMVQRGETIKAIADALDKSTTSIGKYINAYIRPNPENLYVPETSVPSPEQEEDEDEDEDEEDEDEDEDEQSLLDISIKTTKPVPGAPHPRWLSAKERRLVQEMRGRGETKRDIVKALNKPRVKVVKYINAYMVPHEATAVPASLPAPCKRKRSADEPQPEPQRCSKRLRQSGGTVCLDSVIVRRG